MPEELIELMELSSATEVPEEWLRRVRKEFLSEEDGMPLRTWYHMVP